MTPQGGNEVTIAVVCNGLEGEFDPEKRVFFYPRRCEGRTSVQAFTPTEFERHAGMAASKKWKYSVRVDVDAEPGIEWDVASLGPYTLGKWLEVNGFDNKPGRPRGFHSVMRTASVSKSNNFRTIASENGREHQALHHHGDKDVRMSREEENSPLRRRWLNVNATTLKSKLDKVDDDCRADLEKFRVSDTGPRIGQSFQIEVPDCLECKPSADPDNLAHPEREGTVLFGSEEEARKSAGGPEKEGANGLPLCAVYDSDESSDDESETFIQREKSRRTRRRPKWLQGSVNMFTKEEEEDAGQQAMAMRHSRQRERAESKNYRLSPESTKQSMRCAGRKTKEELEEETPRSSNRNPFFGTTKGQKKSGKKKRDENKKDGFEIGKIEVAGDGSLRVVILGRDGEKWSGVLAPSSAGGTTARSKSSAKEGQRPKKKAKKMESSPAHNNLNSSGSGGSPSKKLIEQMKLKAEKDLGKKFSLNTPSKKPKKGGSATNAAPGNASRGPKEGLSLAQHNSGGGSKCATETCYVGGKVKTIHRGSGGRFTSPNGPKSGPEAEAEKQRALNKYLGQERPSSATKAALSKALSGRMNSNEFSSQKAAKLSRMQKEMAALERMHAADAASTASGMDILQPHLMGEDLQGQAAVAYHPLQMIHPAMMNIPFPLFNQSVVTPQQFAKGLMMNGAGQPGAAQLHTFPGLPGMPVGLHIPTAPIQTAMHQMPNGGTQFAFDQSMMKALYDQQKG